MLYSKTNAPVHSDARERVLVASLFVFSPDSFRDWRSKRPLAGKRFGHGLDPSGVSPDSKAMATPEAWLSRAFWQSIRDVNRLDKSSTVWPELLTAMMQKGRHFSCHA